MMNSLLTDLGLSIPPIFLFKNFMDKFVLTSVDLAFYTFERFHLPLLFDLLPLSDPGHKKFSTCETGSMQKNPGKICISHISIITQEYLGFPK